jgi:hypothetical protein
MRAALADRVAKFRSKSVVLKPASVTGPGLAT